MMSSKKGFSLIEIIVVMVIIAILSVIAIPSYTTMTQQGASTAAEHNLITIFNAERNYYFKNSYYCTQSSQSPTCADNLADLNSSTSLNLNISDNNFNYNCIDPTAATDSNNGSTFTCYATNKTDSNFILTVTNTPLVLPGGTPPLNPSCVNATNPSYCPTN